MTGKDLVGVSELHAGMVDDYRAFTSSFVKPRDARIAGHVERLMESGERWPAPWPSLSPAFAPGGSISELVDEGLLHPECRRIFRLKSGLNDTGEHELRLHRHQRDAIEVARTGGLRADHRHGIGQVPVMHRADRGSGAAGAGRRSRCCAEREGDRGVPLPPDSIAGHPVPTIASAPTRTGPFCSPLPWPTPSLSTAWRGLGSRLSTCPTPRWIACPLRDSTQNIPVASELAWRALRLIATGPEMDTYRDYALTV